MLPTTRNTFAAYCMRLLGDGVIQINISLQQVEDRIDKALLMFREYHFDGTETSYMKHRITASTLEFNSAITDEFDRGERVIGQTSGAEARVVDHVSDTKIRVKHIIGSFEVNEALLGQASDITASLKEVVLGDIDNGYIIVPEHVISVFNLFPLGSSTRNMFDYRYQTMLHYIHDFGALDMTSYYMTRTHFALIDDLFNGEKPFRYSRTQDKLYLDWDWRTDVKEDDYIVINVMLALDPAEYGKIWSSPWLIDYATCQLKMQWANNTKKYNGIQLLNGVTLNGQDFYNEAKEELKELEDKLRIEFQEPPPFLMG